MWSYGPRLLASNRQQTVAVTAGIPLCSKRKERENRAKVPANGAKARKQVWSESEDWTCRGAEDCKVPQFKPTAKQREEARGTQGAKACQAELFGQQQVLVNKEKGGMVITSPPAAAPCLSLGHPCSEEERALEELARGPAGCLFISLVYAGLSHVKLQVPLVDTMVAYWKQAPSSTFDIHHSNNPNKDIDDELQSAFVKLDNGKNIRWVFCAGIGQELTKILPIGKCCALHWSQQSSPLLW